MHVHGSEERLQQAARGDRGDWVDGLEAVSVLKKTKEREETARLEEESSTWPVIETN